MKNRNLILVVVSLLALLVGFGGGFYFKNYQLRRVRGNGSMMGQFFGNGNGGNFPMMGGNRNGNGGQRMFGGAVVGQVTAMDDKSITVKLNDGSSKIVVLGDSTKYVKTQDATKGDLKTGETISVFGQANSDGSVTAQNIQINPSLRVFASPQPNK